MPYGRLLLSKAFYELTWGRSGISLQLLTEVNKRHTEASSVPSDEKGKYLCYIGIYQLVSGERETGVQHLQEAISLMSHNLEETLLKIIAFQILAVNFKFLNDASMASAQFYNALQATNEVGDTQLIVIPPNEKTKMQIDVKTTLHNQPAILQVIYIVKRATEFTSDLEQDTFQRNILLNTLNEVEASLQDSGSGLVSFNRICVHLLRHFSKGCNESQLREQSIRNMQAALQQSNMLFGEKYSATAADSFHSVGVTQHDLGEFTSALQSKQRALEIRRTLFGEEHSATADSYHSVGVKQHHLGEFKNSILLPFCTLLKK